MKNNYIEVEAGIKLWLDKYVDYLSIVEGATNNVIKYAVEIYPINTKAASLSIGVDADGYIYFTVDNYIVFHPEENFMCVEGEGEYANSVEFTHDVLNSVFMGNLNCYKLMYKDKVVGVGGELLLQQHDSCKYQRIDGFGAWVLNKVSLLRKENIQFCSYEK